MKLIDYIAKIPYSRLVELVGTEVIRGLQEFDMASRPREVAEILYDLKGIDIFKSPSFLNSLIYTFSEKDIRSLNSNFNNETISDLELYRDKLQNQKWGINDFSKAVLRFFELDEDSFLAPTDPDRVDSEKIIPRLSLTNVEFDGTKVFIPEMYPLHSYQKSIKDNLVEELFQSGSRLILHMPTGSGKTKTAVEAIVDFWRVKGKRTGFIVWLSHSKELCEQSYSTFKDTWQAKGDFPIQMYKIFENFTPNLNKVTDGILFIGFQKFYSLLNRTPTHAIPLRLRDDTRLVVVDESHKSLAPTFLRVINFLTLAASTRLIGLTATPGRSSDLNAEDNQVLAQLYKTKKLSICDEYGHELPDPIKYLQDNKYLAKLRRVAIDSNVIFSKQESQSIEKSQIIPLDIVEKLSTNNLRNAKILNEIEKAVLERNDPTLVFATSLSHAVILKILIKQRGINADCVFGSTPNSQRRRIISDFKENRLPVLINYAVLSTGFDAPNIRTLVICRPTTSMILYSQMLGRALRGPKMGSIAETNTLVDIVDNYGVLGTERAAFKYFDEYFLA